MTTSVLKIVTAEAAVVHDTVTGVVEIATAHGVAVVRDAVTGVVEVLATPGTAVVEVAQTGPQGIPGGTGPAGDAGATGAAGGQPLPILTSIMFPSSVWTVTHSFPYSPEVITRDTDGIVIYGDVSYLNSTHVTVTWYGAQVGTVELM